MHLHGKYGGVPYLLLPMGRAQEGVGGADEETNLLFRMRAAAGAVQAITLWNMMACLIAGGVIALWAPVAHAVAWTLLGIAILAAGDVQVRAFLATPAINPADLSYWRLRIILPRFLFAVVWTSLMFFAWDDSRIETFIVAYMFVVGTMSQSAAVNSALPELAMLEMAPKIIVGVLLPFHHWQTSQFDGGDTYLDLALAVIALMTAVFALRLVRDQYQSANNQFEQLRMLLVSAREADENERAKDAFLSKIMHDLRSPLATIVAGAELHRRLADEEGRERNMRRISEASLALNELLNRLTELSGRDRRDKAASLEQSFDVRETLEGAVYLMRGLAKAKQIGLELVIDHDVPRMLTGRQEQVRRLVLNLVGNALRFNQAGEVKVHVGTGGVFDEAGKFQPHLEIRVSDTGPSFPPEALTAIFDFGAAAARGEDEGRVLGIAIGRSLAAQLDGALDVKSIEGTGVEIVAAIPFAALGTADQIPCSA
ncbi:MAG: sensor histidine kinase [Hyphomicrobiaceae bacterium]